jgi:hypothetical protein
VSYPALRILRTSTPERAGGQEAARATNGRLRLRRLWSAEKTDFGLEHALTDDERTTLEAHYQANKDASFSFTWPEDGSTYTVAYGAAPRYQRQLGWWTAQVTLLEV